jgi:hypothetical protein
MRLHWVAVPKALRARRVNRRDRPQLTSVSGGWPPGGGAPPEVGERVARCVFGGVLSRRARGVLGTATQCTTQHQSAAAYRCAGRTDEVLHPSQLRSPAAGGASGARSSRRRRGGSGGGGGGGGGTSSTTSGSPNYHTQNSGLTKICRRF